MEIENIIAYTLTFQHGAEEIGVVFSVSRCCAEKERGAGLLDSNQEFLNQFLNQFFNQKEKEHIKTFKYEKRLRSFLLGRHAAKIAVGKLINSQKYSQIVIENGVLHQPVVYLCENTYRDGGARISISHSDWEGAALAYPQKAVMGIDIERIDSEKDRLILKIITPAEREMVHKSAGDAHDLLALLWSAREALSKCVNTGFTVPMEYFEIKDVAVDQNMYAGAFKNFFQYRFTGIKWRGCIITLVYPKKMVLDAESESFLKSLA